MDGWMDGRTDGRMDGWMDGWTDGRMDERTDGRTDGWTDGRTDGWMDGWMDGWIDYAMYHFFISKMSEGGFYASLDTSQQGNSSREACDESSHICQSNDFVCIRECVNSILWPSTATVKLLYMMALFFF